MALSAMKSAVPPLNPCVDQQRSHLSFAGDELSFMIIPIKGECCLSPAVFARGGRWTWMQCAGPQPIRVQATLSCFKLLQIRADDPRPPKSGQMPEQR